MKLKTIFSLEFDVNKIMTDISKQFSENNFIPKHIIYFLSVDIEQESIAQAMFDTFACDCIGATSSGEYVDDKFFAKAFVAIGFDNDFFEDFKILPPVEWLDIHDFFQISNEFSKYFAKPMAEFESNKYFAITLMDATNSKYVDLADVCLDLFQSTTSIPILGGLASDYGRLKCKYIHYNGKIYQNSVLFGVYKPNLKFDFLFTHAWKPTNHSVFPTEIEADQKTVKKCDDVSAVDKVFNYLGFGQNNIPDNYNNKYVLARKYAFLGKEKSKGLLYINPFIDILPDGSLVFFRRVKHNGELCLLEVGDIVEKTRKDITDKQEKNKEKSLKTVGILEFNCRGRSEELTATNKVDEYASIFDFAPHIAMSTDAEIFYYSMAFTSICLYFYE